MLYYHIYNNVNSQIKDWVILIHGAGGSSNIWYKQIKDYRANFNVLCIDLRGHGKSTDISWNKNDRFPQIAQDVIDVLDHLNIKEAHFVGISLGTIIVQTIASINPIRVKSMVLSGAIIKLDFRTKFLIAVGNIFKRVMPYMWLYRIFAWIIMPKKEHFESRLAFVLQAKKMCQKEFIRWFRLTKSLNPFLTKLQNMIMGIPTLFVMGVDDYIFLNPIKELVRKHSTLKLECIEECGHVCNIDQPKRFNDITINFFKQTT